jgi:hypothetical protein
MGSWLEPASAGVGAEVDAMVSKSRVVENESTNEVERLGRDKTERFYRDLCNCNKKGEGKRKEPVVY